MDNENKKKITVNFGCTIPIIALLCLLALLEIIKWKTALIIGLFIMITPLIMWLVVLIGVGLMLVSGGLISLWDLFKQWRKS